MGLRKQMGNSTEWATWDPTQPLRQLAHLPCQGWITVSPTSERNQDPPCSTAMCQYQGCRCRPRLWLNRTTVPSHPGCLLSTCELGTGNQFPDVNLHD